MHVISITRIKAFAALHPDCQAGLMHWFKIMRTLDFDDIQAVRRFFPHADKEDQFTIFNIGGNKCRLIAAIHYNRKKVYIRHILTHSEYDQGKWKQ